MTIEMAEQILGVYTACLADTTPTTRERPRRIREPAPPPALPEPSEPAARRIKVRQRRYGRPFYRIRHNDREYIWPCTPDGYQAALVFARTIEERQ